MSDLTCAHCGRSGRQVYEDEGPVAWLRLTLAIFLPSAGIYGDHVEAKPVDLCSVYCLRREIDGMIRSARREAILPVSGALPSDAQCAAIARKVDREDNEARAKGAK